MRRLAKTLQVDYLGGQADVGRAARERRSNLEGVARELRYRYFLSLVDQGSLDVVATGHSANDQAETVLMRLLRGSGTRGLGGIYPQFYGKVIRPFLGLTRAEVMREVSARGISYRVDCSNLDVRLLRNKVRMELLPLLAKEYNPQIIPLLNQLAERARDDEAWLERAAREHVLTWCSDEGSELRLPVRNLTECSPALARRALRQMLENVCGSAHGLTHLQIESIRRFAAEAQSGRSYALPGGAKVRKEFSWVVISPRADSSDGVRDYSYPVCVPSELVVRELGCLFHFKILARAGASEAYNLSKLIVLDPQKLPGELVLRNWRPGDRFCPMGSRGVRKLKELFSERKIPKARREGWPVLTCAGQVVWVRGFPPDRVAAASDKSSRVLIVEDQPLPPLSKARQKPI